MEGSPPPIQVFLPRAISTGYDYGLIEKGGFFEPSRWFEKISPSLSGKGFKILLELLFAAPKSPFGNSL